MIALMTRVLDQLNVQMTLVAICVRHKIQSITNFYAYIIFTINSLNFLVVHHLKYHIQGRLLYTTNDNLISNDYFDYLQSSDYNNIDPKFPINSENLCIPKQHIPIDFTADNFNSSIKQHWN